MRQWHLPVDFMCDKHLLGEHVEMHMFVGSVQKGIYIDNYVRKQLLLPQTIFSRHDLLAAEILRRDMQHKSELSAVGELNEVQKKLIKLHTGLLPWDMYGILGILSNRCPQCNERIKRYWKDGILDIMMQQYHQTYLKSFCCEVK